MLYDYEVSYTWQGIERSILLSQYIFNYSILENIFNTNLMYIQNPDRIKFHIEVYDAL